MDTVFYSWQATAGKRSNRGLIKRAMEIALSKIRQDDSIETEPELDEATRNTRGSVHIAKAIYRKIRKARAAVCDVSIVTPSPIQLPNPNVSIEMGYAAGRLGWNRVIPVFNQALNCQAGSPFDPKAILPFDIGFRSCVLYSLTEADAEDEAKRKAARAVVASQLAERLKTLFDKVESKAGYVDISKVPYIAIVQQDGSVSEARLLIRVATGIALNVGCYLVDGNSQLHVSSVAYLKAGEQKVAHVNYTNRRDAPAIYLQFQSLDRRQFRSVHKLEWPANAILPNLCQPPSFQILRRDKWIDIK
jgi:hypothetical protein